MHAPSRSPYDPGEKLTVTGLSSGPFICHAGCMWGLGVVVVVVVVGTPGEKVNHGVEQVAE